MKKRFVSLMIILVMVIGFTPILSFAVMSNEFTGGIASGNNGATKSSSYVDKQFIDVPSDKWYVTAINYAVAYGIFSGTSKTTFEPNKNMTRAQFVQVLANLSDIDTKNTNVKTTFSDVPSGKWFTPAVKWASENGVVNGVGKGKFNPNANVTREQMCVMLTNYAKFKGITLNSVSAKAYFADDNKISSWAKTAVYICQQADIVTGKGANIFDPQGKGTRAEAATIFTRFHEDYLVDKKTEADNSLSQKGEKGEKGDKGDKGDPGEVDYSLVYKKTEVDNLLSQKADIESAPEYWRSELETKADTIQQAMEKAGRNKSAFLWYTDAHWVNGNSKVSPKLLNYLYKNTPMNKVNFGGDIVGNSLLATREEMKYLYEWREAIKDLPNHHSVFGNHDMFESSSVDYENDNYRYAFMLAPEETNDMVMGDGNFYYIDNPAEKTRYLYLAYPSTVHTELKDQGKFIINAITTVAEGWHIVVIAHKWWNYGSDLTPATGGIGGWETDVLSVFDAYNARTIRSGSNYFYEQDFTTAKGKVEFCIGGHLHTDYDFTTDGGIPVIITTADANQERISDTNLDCGTIGTTTEAAVYGIIADYNDSESTQITVVGVGRGTSRVIKTTPPTKNPVDKNDGDLSDTSKSGSDGTAKAYAK